MPNVIKYLDGTGLGLLWNKVEEELEQKADAATIPTKVSDLLDDSGHYTKPVTGIPASDLEETYLTQHQDISGKANSADLATVATSGDYDDLINKPTIPEVPVQDVQINGNSIISNNIATIPIADTQVKLGLMQTHQSYGTTSGTSGNRTGIICIFPAQTNDIKTGTHSYRPIVPGKQHEATFYGLSKAAGTDLANEENITIGTYPAAAKTAIQTMLDVPSNAAMNTAIRAAIGNINSFDMAVVQELPSSDISTHTIYLVPKTGETNDVYDEYVYINSAWEMVGNTQIDLSNYAIKADTVLDTTLSRGRKANTTIGTGSFAFGSDVEASGSYSHAEGFSTISSGYYSHVEGMYSTASGSYSHAEGQRTTASGASSHAEGQSSTAKGKYSHSEGFYTSANASGSHAEGYYTKAEGSASSVAGKYNIEDSYASWPEWVANTNYIIGDKVKITTTENNETTVIGYICKTDNNDSEFTVANWKKDTFMNLAEIIGNGTADNARSNARALSWEGDEFLAGDLYVHANTDSTGGNKVATVSQIPDVSIYAIKTDTVLETTLSRGRKENTTAGTASLAFGVNTEASGYYSVALGLNTTASSQGAYAEGKGTVAHYIAHAEGEDSQALGQWSHAQNVGTIANGGASSASGRHTIANGADSFVIGKYNTEDSYDNWPTWTANTSYEVGDRVKRNLLVQNEPTDVGYHCTVANSDATFDNAHWELDGYHMNYVEIVGNGKEYEDPETHQTVRAGSNAYALEWNGTGHFAGDVYVNANADSSGGIKLAAVSDLQVNGSSIINNGIANIDSVMVPGTGIGSIKARDFEYNETIYSNEANGRGAFAEGNSNIASGNFSHAEGVQNKANGGASHVEGQQNIAMGARAHAEGYQTFAAAGSHTEGGSTASFTSYSHAEGLQTTAYGRAAHAEGEGSVYVVTLSGSNGTYVCDSTLIEKNDVIIYNNQNYIINNVDDTNQTITTSLTEILENTQIKLYKKNAYGIASHTEGYNTQALSDYQHAQGKYNIADRNNIYADIIGNGTVDTRSNAYALDWQGNGHYMGNIYVGANADSTGGIRLATITEVAAKLDAAEAGLKVVRLI